MGRKMPGPRKRPGRKPFLKEAWDRLSPEERRRLVEGLFLLLSLLPLGQLGRVGAWLKFLAGPGGQVAWGLLRLLKR
ncbi:hypothetical protein TJA_12450 [Thermus sp. LT1-2-5]|uniref:hypothetical protein n=1 Tax=Thermus sp. LT1-2-5 TaxID=3026935 RepID=UPI0030E9A286